MQAFDNIELTWLSEFANRWRAGGAQGRQPHAVLLAGPPGTGKRAAAAWMARHKLAPDTAPLLPTWPIDPLQHADLHRLTLPEDHQAILIDQVRELVTALLLTSYAGRGKVAIIEPANAMTGNAANSLLKTLEEPPGDTLLILVADRPGRLPATIFSRCQRLAFRVPAETESLTWLNRYRPGVEWAGPLSAAGNAPLAAIEAAEREAMTTTLSRDWTRLGEGRASPIDVAGSWAKYEAGIVLEWLARQIQAAASMAVASAHSADNAPTGESVLQRMDSRKLFCYLDQINRLRAQPGGSYNTQLALEGLLIDWVTGLRDGGDAGPAWAAGI